MMDKQEVQINFLDEAESCFDIIESVLLGLSSTVAESEPLDRALRSIHSVKGGAGMMGFTSLSEIAHRLEDFLKILRVRYYGTQINTEVETLLLQGLDGLRQIGDFNRQGTEIEASWLQERIDPIFEQLRQHLGELQDEDEDRLFAMSEDIDPSLLMFEEGVETILEQLETELGELSSSQLSEALVIASEKLLAFGRMANLEPFVQLCESIKLQATIVGEKELKSLQQEALTLWRRSHALVVRGNLEKLPSGLDGFKNREIATLEETGEEQSLIDYANNNLIDNANTINLCKSQSLSSVPADSELNDTENLAAEQISEFDLLTAANLESQDLAELQSAFAQEIAPAQTPILQPKATTSPAPKPPQTPTPTSKMVRVPVEQLYQFNTLFGKLILERNRVNLRLEQLKNFATLMRQRVNQLETSNTKLRNWYDKASVPKIAPITPQSIPLSLNRETHQGQLDALEMDHYSDLHLMSQEQIETIVQLEEVSADIELGLQEMNQAIQELNQTTRSLQGNITRTQMVPFADVVKRFPRLVRDLSLQFGKKVNLKIEGETTLIDRAIVETLNAPLMHLIRNAFDHGIETPNQRIAIGKPSVGNIYLNAVNRGIQTIITVRDDGRGLQFDKIRHRLQEMGIDYQQMSTSQMLDYIFQPGFSTSDQVTELSGRGIGMDVVRTNLQEIRGDIRIKTQAGQGTTFTLTVPFNLSILRVMILERAGMVFAVPVNSVREVLCLPTNEDSSVQNLEQINWQKRLIPLVRLEDNFSFNRPCQAFEMSGNPVIDQPTTLIVGEGSNVGAIQIDRFWGEKEVTIRPINSPLPLPMGFISSMVLGDGRVLPLVDPVIIVQGCLERLQNDDKVALKANPERNKTKNLLQKYLCYQSGIDSGTYYSLLITSYLSSYVPTSARSPVVPETVNTILVVDDSINVRRYLVLALEKAGYQVEQAKDGREAVDKLFSGLAVQAVICDIEMPRLDGYGVLEEVKAKPEFNSLPIVMLTSRSNEKHRKLAMNLGASAYLSKPYKEQELLQKMSELIDLPGKLGDWGIGELG